MRQGEIAKKYAVREELRLRLVEVRDDMTKEPSLTISERKERYSQQLHTRPGRKFGRKFAKKLKRFGDKELNELTPEERAEYDEEEKEKEAMRDAIQVRGEDWGVGVDGWLVRRWVVGVRYE